GTALIGVTVPPRDVGNRTGGAIRLLRPDGKALAPLATDLGRYLSGAPAIARTGDGGIAVVPLVYDDMLAVVDIPTGALKGRVPTSGIAPFASAVSRDGRTAWVSNWGGRLPRDGDLTLPTGLDAKADKVVVDDRGIASTGTVVRVDLDGMNVTHSIDVG